MGVDVYTPAFARMQESDEYKAFRVRYDAWAERPTVEAQDWTEDDHAEYHEIRAAEAKFEGPAGFFRHRSPFESRVGPIRQCEQDSTGEFSTFDLTDKHVGQYLAEWRLYLRSSVRCGEHLDQYVNGSGERVESPFQRAVWRYKRWCQVYRLGEGCYVA